MTINLIIDAIMIVFLGLTMGYAFVLNRNLTNLRNTKNEFEDLVKKLTLAMTSADTSIRNLKLTAQEVGGELDDQIQKATGLSHELQFMVESGDSLARRLEGAAIATPKPKPVAGKDIIDDEPRVKTVPSRSIEDAAARMVMGRFSEDEQPSTSAAKSGLSQPRNDGAALVPGKPRSRAESQLMADFARIEAARSTSDRLDKEQAAR